MSGLSPGKQIGLSILALVIVAGGASWWNSARKPHDVVAADGVHHFTVWMRNWYFVPDHMSWYPGEKVALTLVNESQLVPKLNEQFTAGKELLRAPPGNVLGYGNPLGWKKDLFSGVTLKTASGEFKPHGAFAVSLNPGKSSTIVFTVPNKPGAWCYTSFLQAGFQYMNNMVGEITIRPSKNAAAPHVPMIGRNGVCGRPSASPLPNPVKPSPSGVGVSGLGQS
ncbi:hypothetical protein [Acidihalobacter ferrooxydans]|uniref:Plastocyanin-like domain-containing protein n=1 Tax=Acidihalobacter ferrooxydans TaxID=1765967 RepID=A0A1P8UDS4_9GAMM|nr:hypothetical protein [Acidihalobacter ferrooxydans]APZ41939.1 hypothetical protein BW247_01535 [Acidihalobacter ferrooxydans]